MSDISAMGVPELMRQADEYFDKKSDSYAPEKAADCWEQAAELGSMEALGNLADCYFFGEGRIEDDARAFQMYHRVLDATDNAFCAFQIGRMYRAGWGVQKDYDKALQYLERGWQLGHVAAANDIGAIYLSKAEKSKSVTDVENGLKWFQRAANRGDMYGMYRMALLYAIGDYGMPKDVKRAYDLLMRAKSDSRALGYLVSSNGLNIAGNDQYLELVDEAKRRAEDDSDAELFESLGRAYEDETRLGNDPEKSAAYYERSLECGNGFAGYLLGINYFHGWSGYEVDLEKAEQCLTKGAALNCHQAMNTLGDLYKEKAEFGCWPRNLELMAKAFYWYEKAFQAGGDAYAALHAGEAALEAEDESLYERAAACLYAAAQDDVYFAYAKLAKLSMDSSLSTFNPDRARFALEKARDEDIVEYKTGEVDFLTGQMFEKGIGYPAAIDQAVDFYTKAAEKGWEEAKESLKRFKKGLFGWKLIS